MNVNYEGKIMIIVHAIYDHDSRYAYFSWIFNIHLFQ